MNDPYGVSDYLVGNATSLCTMADALIEIAVRNGPRLGYEGWSWDPVAPWAAVLRSAENYCTAARALGIL